MAAPLPVARRRISPGPFCIRTGVVIAALLYIASFRPWRSGSGYFNGEKLMPALSAYARYTKERGAKLPDYVRVDELVQLGYLKSEDVSAFAGMKTAISLHIPEETQPAAILMEGTLPDRTSFAVHGDGSVQAIPPVRARGALSGTELKTPANLPPPAR